MKKIGFLLICAVFLFGWQLKKNENGIQVYTQGIENSKYDAFKADVTLKKPFAEIEKGLLDFKDYPKWQKKIEKIKIKDGYMLKVLHFPFPLSNRFAFYKIDVKRSKNSLIIKLTSIPYKNLPLKIKKEFKKPSSVEMKDDVVLSAVKTPDGVKVEYSAAVDPRGVPAFIFNSKIIDAGYDTLDNFRNFLK